MENFFEKNLQALYIKNPSLAEKINNYSEKKHSFDFVYTQNTEAILVKDGCILNSAKAPVGEPQRLIEDIITRNNPLDSAFIIGFEIGFLFCQLANSYLGSIVVFEPDIETLKLAFQIVDFSDLLNKKHIYIVTNADELNQTISTVYQKGGLSFILANSHYSVEYKKIIDSLEPQFKALWLEPYKGGDLKLNIGAGNWAVKGWRTLDCYRNADFFVDLRKMEKLDIEDNCIEKAFSSHCFEHLNDDNIQNLFNELYRCMKPDGIFRFCCPDAEKALEAYKNNDVEWFKWLKQSHIGEMLLNFFVSYEALTGGPKASPEVIKEKFDTLNKEDFIDWCISLKDESRPYIAHCNGLYFDKLKKMLEKAGFKNIERSKYLESKDEEFRSTAFDHYPEISIYMECSK